MTSWVKTNKEIAKLLGIKLLRQRNRLRGQLAEINGWRERADFPAYQKGKGYSAVEVLQWGEKFAAIIAPEKQRRAVVAQILSGESPSAKAVKLLQSNVQGPMSTVENDDEGRGTRDEGSENYRPVESIRQLAPRLSAHFKTHITEQRIKQWLDGNLPPGIKEPFPLRDPGRNGWNNPRPCFDWVQRCWIKPLNGALSQDELFAKTFEEAKLAEQQHIIDDARKARAEADAKERENNAKWILRADALSTSIQAMSDLLRIVESEYEKNAPARRRERLAALCEEVRSQKLGDGTGANANFELLVSSFFAFDCEDERGRFDRIKQACQLNAERVTGSAEKGN